MFSFLFKLILLFFFFISTLFADSHILEQENFEAWQYTCVSEQNQKICDLRELVFDSNNFIFSHHGGKPINPDQLTQMQIAFPHAVNLKSPIKLQIDEKDPIDLNYAYCNQSACFVAEIIGENFVNFFKAGNQISIKALFLDNREATITYSLKGFTAGYNRLYSSINN